MKKIASLSFFSLVFLLNSCVTKNKHESYKAHFSSKSAGEISSLNQIIEDLPFFPINGLRFRLSELKNVKAIVIVMREKNCPISEKYGPRLARIEKEYSSKGIQFIYNYVGQVRQKKSAWEDLEKFSFKSPYVIDSRQKVIDALHAKTTGDVFILTPDRRVIYKGPLDDQYHLLKSAIKAKNNYVLDVLSAIIAGKAVVPKELSAPGCVISRPVIKKKSFLKM